MQSAAPFLGKIYFISDSGESRYEPGALMKRTEYPANTLTGPRWLLGNKAKWLLSDSLCLSAAAPHLWLEGSVSLWLEAAALRPSTGIRRKLYTVSVITDNQWCGLRNERVKLVLMFPGKCWKKKAAEEFLVCVSVLKMYLFRSRCDDVD